MKKFNSIPVTCGNANFAHGFQALSYNEFIARVWCRRQIAKAPIWPILIFSALTPPARKHANMPIFALCGIEAYNLKRKEIGEWVKLVAITRQTSQSAGRRKSGATHF